MVGVDQRLDQRAALDTSMSAAWRWWCCEYVILVDSDPRRENPPYLLQTPEPISGWHRYTSITPVTPVNS